MHWHVYAVAISSHLLFKYNACARPCRCSQCSLQISLGCQCQPRLLLLVIDQRRDVRRHCEQLIVDLTNHNFLYAKCRMIICEHTSWSCTHIYQCHATMRCHCHCITIMSCITSMSSVNMQFDAASHTLTTYLLEHSEPSQPLSTLAWWCCRSACSCNRRC